MSGFPLWTLWGMGLSALGALLATILAYIAQSPQFVARPLFKRLQLNLRARTFTGYALALMVLAGGFFLAGVPIGPLTTPDDTAVAMMTPFSDFDTPIVIEEATAVPTSSTTTRTGQSGAFAGPPPTVEGDEAVTAVPSANNPEPEIPTATTAAPSVGATVTATPRIVPTGTPTPLPTDTPTPTVTPTPIEGETATLNIGTSTLWLRRTPGGQTLVLVRGDETIILLPGHANQAGILWQQIMTVDGTVGWVQDEFVAKAEG